jgi:hypothetical protein
MTLVTGAITLTLALFAAQGPRAASARRKKGSPAPTAATAERRVRAPAPVRSPGGAPRRAEAASTTSDAASGAGATSSGDTSGSDASEGASGSASPPAGVKTAKTKVYTFGAMDVEGKLKTPQLLYFLNRVKLELEMSAPDHRSFMKELERTADDPSL